VAQHIMLLIQLCLYPSLCLKLIKPFHKTVFVVYSQSLSLVVRPALKDSVAGKENANISKCVLT